MTQPIREVIPWWVPQVGDLEFDYLRQALESNYLNEGQLAEHFERRLAGLLGVKHAVAVTSGTAALFLALKCLGVGPGDEVLVPDVTFIATANAVTLAGARPVLVDVDPETLTIDAAAAAAAVTSHSRAVIPVHVSGRAADMQAVLDLANRHGLAVVEDAAEALLSYHRGRPLGTSGRLGCFSFSPNKTITTGQGGLIVTDDDRLAVRLRELKDQGRPVRGTGGDDIHASLGFNFKFTNLQAAVGLGQLQMLAGRLRRVRQIYEAYHEALAGVPGLRLPGFREGEVPQWTDAVAEHRDALVRHLTARKMHSRNFWHPLHTQAPYRLPDDGFPRSTALCRQAFWLPSSFTMTAAEQRAVCQAIKEFAHAR
jgi:perosamine synthetase